MSSSISATSDLVCVIGMVDVKVLGPVENGERIYASLEHPGVGIPQSRVFDAVSSDVFLLGQTLAGVEAKSDEVKLVQSFVSVMLSISASHVTRAVGDLREHMKEDVKTEVKQIKKKCLRGNCWRFLAMFSLIASVFLLPNESKVAGWRKFSTFYHSFSKLRISVEAWLKLRQFAFHVDTLGCLLWIFKIFESITFVLTFSGFRRWLLAGFILAVLLGVLLYQLFAPGTALRYYRCSQGSIKGSEMWFTFTTVDKQV